VGAELASTAAAASAWGGYANGQIPLSELTQVGGYYFRNDAAQAMVALRMAYSSALGRALIINDGYRDLAGQQQAWNDYQQGGNLAAPPGTSNHGWALAVDFGGEVYGSSTSAGHQWLQANSAAYGWWWAGRYFSQVESWHWEYTGSDTQQHAEENATLYRRNNNGMSSLFHIQNTDGTHTWALAGDGVGAAAWLQITDVNVANGLALQHGNAVNVDWGTWQAWKAAYTSKQPIQA